MKICWDNLEGVYLSKKGNFTKNKKTLYFRVCISCKEEFLTYRKNGKFCTKKCSNSGIYSPSYGKKLSEETKRKISENRKGKCCGDNNPMKRKDLRKKFSDNFHKHPWSKKDNTGKNNINWSGGYKYERKLCRYDTYAHQIDWVEECKRNIDDPNVLEVKCAYCGRWFVPSWSSINNRIQSLNGNYKGEQRLYCSEECKSECPIYRKIKYPKGYKKATSREVQPELRQMVLKRDEYTCQKCGNTEHLHCHHIKTVIDDPIESADIDNCITYCKECHKESHQKDGCKYNELRMCI